MKRLVCILVGLILGFHLYAWNARTLTGNTLPMPFGYGVAIVLTGSMEPVLKADDLIVIAKKENYETGEIVVYEKDGRMIVHRIIEITKEKVVTKGDANNIADVPFAVSEIKGSVIGHLNDGGILIRFFKKPLVTIVLFLGAILLIEGSYQRDRKRDEEKLVEIRSEIAKLKEENANENKKAQ